MTLIVGFVLVTPLLWLAMFFLLRRTANQRNAFWIGLAIYLLVVGGLVVKMTVFEEGMGDLFYLIFGSIGLSIYTLIALVLALSSRYTPETRNVILTLPPRKGGLPKKKGAPGRP